MNLFKRCGIEALIQQNLIGGVLTLGCLLGGVVTGGICFAWGYAWSLGETELMIVAVVGALAGVVMASLTGVTIESSVATVFVCYAEEPAVLQQTHPQLYQSFSFSCQQFLGNQGAAGPMATQYY